MKSEWIKDRNQLFDQLDKDIECDVLIVGAGLSGLLCAYQLQNHFEKIVLIESDTICSGASGRSTGKITSQHGLIYQEIYKIHGKDKTRLYYEENEQAIHEIEKIIKEYNIECDFRRKDAIVGCKSKSLENKISQEINVYNTCDMSYEKIQNEYGITKGFKVKNQASFDPYQFCIQLADKLDIDIYENTPMMQMHDHAVKTKQHIIRYEHCILATQVMPFKLKFFYAISKPNISFLASLSPSDKSNEMILIDDTVTKTKNDMDEFKLVGGYDHPIFDDVNKKWQSFKRDLILEYPNHTIRNVWRSQDYEVFDYLPIIDKCEDFIVITGFNKWGNSNSYVASLVVKDILLNKETKRRELFRLNRKSLVINKNFIGDNIQVLKALILSKMSDSSFKIPEDDKAISFKIDGHPYGMYRKENDLYIVDIFCPHLGCTLTFNEYEKTWDCPCHGSRFDIEGKIIKGPANVGLHFNKSHVNDYKR